MKTHRRGFCGAFGFCFSCLLTRPVQEGDDLTAGALSVGIEAIVANAGGNAFADRPIYCLVVVFGARHIDEGHRYGRLIVILLKVN